MATKKTTAKKQSSSTQKSTSATKAAPVKDAASSEVTDKSLSAHGQLIVGEIDKLLTSPERWLESEDKHFMSVEYEIWYTSALGVVRQVIPAREHDFTEAYRPVKRKEVTVTSFGIRDFFDGIVIRDGWGSPAFDSESVFLNRLTKQIAILRAARASVGSYVRDLSQVIRSELLDKDVEAASELLRAGYLRSAGVVCGVILEAHLAHVCSVRSISLRKRKPSLADYNNALRQAGAYDVPQWRRIQHLADVRNVCAHKGSREPTKSEVEDLVVGTGKMIKQLS